jgi:hypothetical protein
VAVAVARTARTNGQEPGARSQDNGQDAVRTARSQEPGARTRRWPGRPVVARSEPGRPGVSQDGQWWDGQWWPVGRPGRGGGQEPGARSQEPDGQWWPGRPGKVSPKWKGPSRLAARSRDYFRLATSYAAIALTEVRNTLRLVNSDCIA